MVHSYDLIIFQSYGYGFITVYTDCGYRGFQQFCVQFTHDRMLGKYSPEPDTLIFICINSIILYRGNGVDKLASKGTRVLEGNIRDEMVEV